MLISRRCSKGKNIDITELAKQHIFASSDLCAVGKTICDIIAAMGDPEAPDWIDEEILLAVTVMANAMSKCINKMPGNSDFVPLEDRKDMHKHIDDTFMITGMFGEDDRGGAMIQGNMKRMGYIIYKILEQNDEIARSLDACKIIEVLKRTGDDLDETQRLTSEELSTLHSVITSSQDGLKRIVVGLAECRNDNMSEFIDQIRENIIIPADIAREELERCKAAGIHGDEAVKRAMAKMKNLAGIGSLSMKAQNAPTTIQ